MRILVPLVIVGLFGAVTYGVIAEQQQHNLAPAPETPGFKFDQAPLRDTIVVAQAPAPAFTPAPAPAATPASPAPADAPKVDETALRYFAQQGDTVRMNREIERLRALYPDWEPPADPLADAPMPDPAIDNTWELFQAGEYAATRAAIAAKQANDPGYVPDPQLIALLDLAEAQQRFRNASAAGENQTVVTIAANTPALLTCERIDNLWRLADAFVATDAKSRALDAYTYILTNCTSAEERLATVQKAQSHFTLSELAPLYALEQTDGNGVGEFAPLRLDGIRGAIGASLEPGGTPVSAEDAAAFEQSITEASPAEDLRLLGYFKLDRGRPNEARRLFEQALAKDPSVASAQALAVSYLQLRDYGAAEAALASYSDANEEASALYLDAVAALLSSDPRPTLNPDVLGRMVDAISSTRNANAAQEMGWYAYSFDQVSTALEWFNLALRWQPDLEPAAYGLVVASNAVGDTATVEAVKQQWGNRSARIAAFPKVVETSRTETTRVVPPAVASTAPASAATPSTSTASTSTGGGSGGRSCQNPTPAASLSPGAALTQAWCLMGMNRPAQAAESFERALQSSSSATRSDAAYGQSLAYMRMGLPDNAAVAASSAPLTAQRAVELEIAILSQKAQTAYNAGDYIKAVEYLNMRGKYAPERNDLLTLRAWSYYHMRLFGEARRIFKAVAATGFGDASEGLRLSEQALMIY